MAVSINQAVGNQQGQRLTPQFTQETGLNNIRQYQKSADYSKADRLANDIGKIVAGIEKYSEQQYTLSLDATKQLAQDNLATLEAKTTEITNDKNLSYDQKRSAILGLRSELLTKSSKHINEDVVLQKEYDSIFSNSSKTYLSRVMSKIDSDEYIHNVKIKANTEKDKLIKSPITARWSDYLEGHRELIKMGDTTEETLKLSFIKGKLTAIEDRYKADRTSFFSSDGKFNDDMFNSYFDDDMIKDDRVSQYKTDLINAEDKLLKNESDTIKESILVRAYEANSISEIDGLIGEVKSKVKHNQSKIQGLNALLAMKGRLKSSLDNNTKSELLYSIKNQAKSIENMEYSSMVDADGVPTNSLKEKIDMLFSTIDARFPESTDKERNSYEKATILEKINERVDIAEEVETSDIFKPNPPYISDDADKALNNRRVKTIDYYYRNGNLSKASELMVLNNGLPDSISKDLRQKFETGNAEEITKAVNIIDGMTQDGNMRSIFAKDRNMKYLFSFATQAKKNGLTEKEIDVLQKINSGEVNYSTASEKAKYILTRNFEGLSNDEYNNLYEEARYLSALNIGDEDVIKLLEASKENKIYITSDTDTKVLDSPRWAGEDVVDKSVSILSDLVPDIQREGATVTKNHDDELVIKVGVGENSRTLAILDESTYLSMLSEYRSEGKDDAYNKQVAEKKRIKAVRNMRIAKSSGKPILDIETNKKLTAEEWEQKISEYDDILEYSEPVRVLKGSKKSLIEKLFSGEDLR